MAAKTNHHRWNQEKEVTMEKRNNNGRHQQFSLAAPAARSVQLVGDFTHQQFSLAAPAARSVQLVGDFTLWQEHPISLRRGKDGTWQTMVEMKPGRHRYRFLVDGEWQDDSDCKVRVPNPYGGQ